MRNEKYPSKRGYAVGKLYKFLKERNLYERFVKECKNQMPKHRGHTLLTESFTWTKTIEGHGYWKQLNREFESTL